MPPLRHVFRWLIILFCLWHMAAVGIYSVPSDATDRVSVFSRTYLTPIVRPYLLMTSQWQQWNLFSPDPLRRVTSYALMYGDDAGWHDTGVFHAATNLAIDADTFKILNRLEQNDQVMPVYQRYLQSFCGPLRLKPLTPLRIESRYYVIPPQRLTFEAWRSWQPQWQSSPEVVALCPAT